MAYNLQLRVGGSGPLLTQCCMSTYVPKQRFKVLSRDHDGFSFRDRGARFCSFGTWPFHGRAKAQELLNWPKLCATSLAFADTWLDVHICHSPSPFDGEGIRPLCSIALTYRWRLSSIMDSADSVPDSVWTVVDTIMSVPLWMWAAGAAIGFIGISVLVFPF